MTFNTFLALQIEEIKKHRWIESEKNNRDMTRVAEIDWVKRYAMGFREYIEKNYGLIKDDPCE